MSSQDAVAASPEALRANRHGLLLGGLAVLFWSFGSSLVYLGARAAGTWRFVATASLIGGLIQLLAWRVHRGELHSALVLPMRLWAVSLPCFVAYGIVWPLALVTSNDKQIYGVSLVNYLWPVLTVVLGAWWVPGARLNLRTVVATLLAVAGLLCANLGHLRELLTAGDNAGDTVVRRFLPYALAFTAAVVWSAYSALLARWRAWAQHYATSPVGFLITGAIAFVVSGFDGEVRAAPSLSATLMIIGYGVGPLAAGYLLWEIALAKAWVQALSMLAAATPVLSTLLLCLFLKTLPGPELIVAAFLVSASVLLSVRK